MEAWVLIESEIHSSYCEIGGCRYNMMYEILTWRHNVGGWDIPQEKEAIVSTFQNHATSICLFCAGTKSKGQMQTTIDHEGEVT